MQLTRVLLGDPFMPCIRVQRADTGSLKAPVLAPGSTKKPAMKAGLELVSLPLSSIPQHHLPSQQHGSFLRRPCLTLFVTRPCSLKHDHCSLLHLLLQHVRFAGAMSKEGLRLLLVKQGKDAKCLDALLQHGTPCKVTHTVSLLAGYITLDSLAQRLFLQQLWGRLPLRLAGDGPRLLALVRVTLQCTGHGHQSWLLPWRVKRLGQLDQRQLALLRCLLFCRLADKTCKLLCGLCQRL